MYIYKHTQNIYMYIYYKFTNKCKYRNINMYISTYTEKDIHKHTNIHTSVHKHTDGDLFDI